MERFIAGEELDLTGITLLEVTDAIIAAADAEMEEERIQTYSTDG